MQLRSRSKLWWTKNLLHYLVLYIIDLYGPLQIILYSMICPEASWVQILRGTPLQYVMRRKIQS
jgi:hypothetical protein